MTPPEGYVMMSSPADAIRALIQLNAVPGGSRVERSTFQPTDQSRMEGRPWRPLRTGLPDSSLTSSGDGGFR